MKLWKLEKLILKDYCSIDNFAAVIGMKPEKLKNSLNGIGSFTVGECEKIFYVLNLVNHYDFGDIFFSNEPEPKAESELEPKPELEPAKAPAPEDKSEKLLFPVTEREAYLIHRMRQDPGNAKTVYMIMQLPYDEKDLEKYIEEGKELCIRQAEANKKRLISLYSLQEKSDNYVMKVVRALKKNCRELIEQKRKYLLDLQAERVKNMNDWIESIRALDGGKNHEEIRG